MTRSPAPSLTLSDISLSRGGRLLVSGVNLSLAAGDCLLVEGANGSGKSSLLRMLAALLPVDSGRLHVAGKTAWLGHENALAAEYSLRSEMLFWTGQLPPPDVDDFDMSPLMDMPVHMLSQGQKRRAALWRLAASHADIWLLDEPAAGLDLRNRDRLLRLISRHLQDGGITVIAAHGDMDLPDAQRLALGGLREPSA